MQRARANRLETRSIASGANRTASQLVDKAVDSVTELVQKEMLRRYDLEVLTTALFETSVVSLEAAVSTNDVRLAASLLTCVHDPDILRDTLSIARSKKSTQILLMISEHISTHGLFTVPSLSPAVPVHEGTLAMRYAHDCQVHELKELWLSDSFFSLKHCTFNGHTALMMAANHGYDACVSILLNEFATESSESSALLLAMTNGHYRCIQLLSLEVGLNGVTPLMYYASLGNVAHVGHCLENPVLANYLRCQTTTGWTALMFAAAGGFTLCVKLLLADEQGMQDNNGETALMKAASRNNHNVIQLLLQQSFTELGMKAFNGQTALMIAVQNTALESVSLLQQHEQDLRDFTGATALMFAAQKGFIEAVATLCLKEANIKDNFGLTALMYAAMSGYCNCVQLLATLEAGAQDESGTTALMFAVQNGHYDCVRYLLGKELGLQDRTGWTALMWATQGNYATCVKEILDWHMHTTISPCSTLGLEFQPRGVDTLDSCVDLSCDTSICFSDSHGCTSEIGMQSSNGSTALMIAAQKDHLSCAQLLANYESGIVDSSGSTALMKAAFSGASDIVLLLLESEARIQRQDGLTALMYAAQAGMDSCVQLLIPWELGMVCTGGKTALMFAARG